MHPENVSALSPWEILCSGMSLRMFIPSAGPTSAYKAFPFHHHAIPEEALWFWWPEAGTWWHNLRTSSLISLETTSSRRLCSSSPPISRGLGIIHHEWVPIDPKVLQRRADLKHFPLLQTPHWPTTTGRITSCRSPAVDFPSFPPGLCPQETGNHCQSKWGS